MAATERGAYPSDGTDLVGDSLTVYIASYNISSCHKMEDRAIKVGIAPQNTIAGLHITVNVRAV